MNPASSTESRLTQFARLFLGLYFVAYALLLAILMFFPKGGSPSWLLSLEAACSNAVHALAFAVYVFSALGFVRPRRLWMPIAAFPMAMVLLCVPALIWNLGQVALVDAVSLLQNPPAFLTATSPSKFLISSMCLVGMAIGAMGLFFIRSGLWKMRAGGHTSVLACAFAHTGAAVVLIPTFAFFLISFTMASLTHGFLKIGRGGLVSEQRTYTKDSLQVVLVPMVHIGRDSFYKQVLADFNTKGTLMIFEGVSDRNKLLKSSPPYREIAANLGLSDQGTSFVFEKESQIALEHGDVDASAFKPESIAMLNEIFASMAARGPLAGSAPISDAYASLLFDLLEKRNARLMEVLDKAVRKQKHERILVPWGALHMIGIEAALLERGFVLSDTKPRSI